MLKEKRVTFAITKYGREGLDEPHLDTIILNDPLSDPGAIQQMMGRILRRKAGKREPIVLFMEDDVGLLIGMLNKARAYLSNWPADEGGPFAYSVVNHPRKKQVSIQWK